MQRSDRSELQRVIRRMVRGSHCRACHRKSLLCNRSHAPPRSVDEEHERSPRALGHRALGHDLRGSARHRALGTGSHTHRSEGQPIRPVPCPRSLRNGSSARQAGKHSQRSAKKRSICGEIRPRRAQMTLLRSAVPSRSRRSISSDSRSVARANEAGAKAGEREQTITSCRRIDTAIAAGRI